MSEKSPELKVYEELEQNKAFYISYINDYLSRIDASIKSHDFNILNSIYDEILKLLGSKRNPLLYTSLTFRILSIIEAMNLEYKSRFKLFWDDVSGIDELFYKYNKTIFMIRRLTYELPEAYKQEAHVYLQTISPYIVNAAFNDSTVQVGNPEYIYISLAMDFIKTRQYRQSLIFLQFINRKNSEVLELIDQLKAFLRDKD